MDSVVEVSLNENRDAEICEANLQNVANEDEDVNYDCKKDIDIISDLMQELRIENDIPSLSPLKTDLSSRLSPNNRNFLSLSFDDTNSIQENPVCNSQHNENKENIMNVRNTVITLAEILEKIKRVREQSIPSYKYLRLDEQYSRKVFVGGLPPDIYEHQIAESFSCFGPLDVDWPHKFESGSYFPPKGYAFLHFESDHSVKNLIRNCKVEYEKLYWLISSTSVTDIEVEIRPWCEADADFIADSRMPLDPRKTVFLGGVPRPMKALELAAAVNRLYGGVSYVSIDTDSEHKYPKGSGRVTFNNSKSMIKAITDRFIQIKRGDTCKQIEVKPYVLLDQMCDGCNGSKCYGRFAPFFCANIMCLKYLCETCWHMVHSEAGLRFHKPFIKGINLKLNPSYRRF